MNKQCTYLFFILVLLALAGCGKKDTLPNLEENYSYKDTKPFGARTAYRIFENSFPDSYKQIVHGAFSKAALEMNSTDALYFCVSRYLFTDEKDADAILNFVYEGNTAFFSASFIDSTLLNKIKCKAESPGFFFYSFPLLWQQTSVRLANEFTTVKENFGFFYTPFANYFSDIDTVNCKTVGYNNTSTNCIVVFYGKGKLFLHMAPRAFGNYFLLKDNNYQYMLELLQLMNNSPRNVYWDDYYSKKNNPDSDGSFSSLSEIMKYPPLAMAFWILLALLVLYVLFGAKRRQRIIPVKKINENSSVAFTETIARLYLQKNDNKNIADKMITYFHEYVRNNYFLNAGYGNDQFIHTLSRKSGVSLEKTTSLYRAIHHANNSSMIDDYQLLSLSEQIQQFYKSRH